MKTLSLTVACLAALALVSLTQAEEAHKIKLILDGSPESGRITIEADDLAIGETRSYTSEKGRPVLVTRGENGLEIDVDGKKTVIDLLPSDGEGFELHTFGHEGEPGEGGQAKTRVIVKKMGGNGQVLIHEGDTAIDIKDGKIVLDDSQGKEVRIIRLGEGDGKHLRILDGHDKDGQAKKVHVMVAPGADLSAARAKLIRSGALDGLDAATRERILAALDGEQR
jgi:hypothetical protein